MVAKIPRPLDPPLLLLFCRSSLTTVIKGQMQLTICWLQLGRESRQFTDRTVHQHEF